jgi:uncharacterized protein with PQ loop repeat
VFGNIIIYPQLYLILKNKSAWDVSSSGFMGTFIFSVFGLIYGIFKKDTPMMISNALLGFGSLLIIIAIHIYK